MLSKRSCRVIREALRRERVNVEMSDLSKDHEAQEFADIDTALAEVEAAALASHAVGQLGLELVPDGDYELSHEWGTWILHVHSDGAHLEQWNKNNTFPNGAPVDTDEIWLGDFRLYRPTPAPTVASEGNDDAR